MNTDFPVVTVVERINEGKRPVWIVTYNLCNGVPDGADEFKTRHEALKRAGV
jgi:hypothetical protein